MESADLSVDLSDSCRSQAARVFPMIARPRPAAGGESRLYSLAMSQLV